MRRRWQTSHVPQRDQREQNDHGEGGLQGHDLRVRVIDHQRFYLRLTQAGRLRAGAKLVRGVESAGMARRMSTKPVP